MMEKDSRRLFRIREAKSEWEGMALVALVGNPKELQAAGFGAVEAGFREPYVVLRSPETGRECGAILKVLGQGEDLLLDIDPCLLIDLASPVGATLEVWPAKASPARRLRVAISKAECHPQEMKNLLKTYLLRHPFIVGQKKPIFLLTGERITVEAVAVEGEEFPVFTASTEILVDATPTASAVAGLDEVGGLEEEKRLIKERILMPLLQPEFFAVHGIHPPRGILLCGPPGCGKTLMARALSAEIRANFFELSGPEVFSPLVGESEKALRDLFKRAREKPPAVVLIDELDALGSSRAEMRGDPEKRVVTALLTEMDGLRAAGDVIVVATTNAPDVIDPALRRPGRFDYEIHIGVPDRKGRLEILEILTRRMALSSQVDLSEIATSTHGFVGADLMLVCREAAFEALMARHSLNDFLQGTAGPMTGLEIGQQDFLKAVKKTKPSALREFALEVPTGLGWNEVGGLREIKETVIQEIIRVIQDPDSFAKVGITPVKGILLYGPPGTGKTMIARVLANEAGANFIAIKGPEVLSKWFGESEKRIRTLFAKARQSSPCIIFFDEIDAISASRGRSVSDAGDRVVNQLLTEMDDFETGRHVCVVAATNRIELVDPALLRPGRFDYQLLVPLPDREAAEEIYRIHLRSKPLAEGIDLKKVVSESTDFSGAHIAEVCRRAALAAFRENDFKPEGTWVTESRLLDAVRQVRTTREDVERPKIGFTP